jgi:hypothetical protein
MEKPRSFAAVVVTMMLLLPMLYVGSYVFMQQPTLNDITGKVNANYRLDGPFEQLYWPLEQMDRKLRAKSRQDRQRAHFEFEDVGT